MYITATGPLTFMIVDITDCFFLYLLFIKLPLSSCVPLQDDHQYVYALLLQHQILK